MDECRSKIDSVFSYDFKVNSTDDSIQGCTDELSYEIRVMIDTLFLTICTALIFLMQAGFALLEVGSVQLKNAKSILIKNLLDGSVGSLGWWAFGYGIAFGDTLDNPLLGMHGYFLNDVSSEHDLKDLIKRPNAYTHWAFHWAFATTAATIVSGCVAERMSPSSYLIFSGFITAFFYPVIVHWVWSDSGWLLKWGFYDFAGCATVHMVGGASGLVGAIMLGPRTGRFDLDGKPNPMPAHNMVLSTLGCLTLWFGWYGFNCGSVGSLATTTEFGGVMEVGKVFINTTLSAATAGIVTYGVESYITGVRDLPPLINGILGGLVSVTGSANCIDTWAAVLIGCIGAFIYCGGSRLLLSSQIDDPLDAFALHGLCGIWGIIAVGIFANDSKYAIGLLYGSGGLEQLGKQIVGALVTMVWSVLTSAICFRLIDVCVGLRVSLNDEKIGMDEAHHGGSAYPDFVKKRGAPIQDVVIVMTDVETPRELWKKDPSLMVHCQTLHDTIMRNSITDHHGYEISAEGDNFKIAFHNAEDAINFGFAVQSQLLQTTWPEELLADPKCALIYAFDANNAKNQQQVANNTPQKGSPSKLTRGHSVKKSKKHKKKRRSSVASKAETISLTKKSSRPIFNGLRVRMAMDYGYCDHAVNPMTEKFTYSGTPYDHCKAILKAIQSGGQIVITKAMNKALLEADDVFQDSSKVSLGTHIIKDVEEHLELIQCLPQDLAERELLPLISVRKVSPDYFDAPSANVAPGLPIPPVTIVCTQMVDTALRKVRAGMVERVMTLHDIVLRKFLQDNEGYECHAENGRFMLAFPSPELACSWVIATHISFLKLDWSKEPKQVADAMANMKIKMGMSSGIVEGVEPHCDTGRADYFGDVVGVTVKCCESSASGEVSMSEKSYMMLPSKHPFGINVGNQVKLGKGSQTVQTYSLVVPTSTSVNPEHYRHTKWKRFTIMSEAEEERKRREKERENLKVNMRGKLLLGGERNRSVHEVQPIEGKEAGPFDILATSKLEAWKIDETELDFESGFFVASGSFGDVKTAKFRGTMVAVKMLKKKGKHIDSTELMRFKHELLLCRDLRHPNVMQVLGGCWDHEDKIFLVMEFCEKGSLGALLKREGAQYKMVTTKLNWVIELAKAMCYLHGFNPPIVHRDLKGDNVLVNQGLNVKLCDFGESRKKTNEGTMTTVGSPFWIAPEVFLGERYDESCDVYSFALVMIEVLFDGDMEGVFNRGMKNSDKKFGLAIAHKITSGWRPRLDPSIVERFPNYCQLIEDCWQHAPKNRPTFARILDYLLKMQVMVDIGRDQEASNSSGSYSSSSYGSGQSTTIDTMSSFPSSLSSTPNQTPSSSVRDKNYHQYPAQRGSFRGPTMPSLREKNAESFDSSEETSSHSGSNGSGSFSGTSSSLNGEEDSQSPRSEGRRTFTGSAHGSIREEPNEESDGDMT